MEVKYIKIDEKEYPVMVNFEALMETEERTGKALKDFADFKLKDYLELFHQSLIAGGEEKGEKYKADKAATKKLLNKCYGDFIQMVPDFFEELLPRDPVRQKREQ